MGIAKSLIAVVGILCLMVSCSKSEDVENFVQGEAGADLKVIGRSFDLKSTFAKVIYTQVQAEIQEVAFKHEDSNGVLSDIEYNGHYQIDLLTGSSTPKMNTAYLKAGKYVGFQASIAPGSAGSSFVCKAEFTNSNNQKVNVAFSTNKTLDIAYTSRTGFVIKEGDVYTFVLTFILPTLFDGVNLDNAQVKDGVVLINASENSALAIQVEHNISKAIDYAYQINGVSLPF